MSVRADDIFKQERRGVAHTPDCKQVPDEKDTPGEQCSVRQPKNVCLAENSCRWTSTLQECGAPQDSSRTHNSGQLWTNEGAHGLEPMKETLGEIDPADLVKGEEPGYESANVVLGAMNPVNLFEDLDRWPLDGDEEVPDTTSAGNGDNDQSVDMPLR